MPTVTALYATPHPDLETGIPRQPFRYHVTSPATGINEETGLILIIDGYGGHADTDYQKKLRPYLADKYNCLAVGVEYFGQRLKAMYQITPLPDFFVKLKEHHGVAVSASGSSSLTSAMFSLLQVLYDAGITSLDPSCRIIRWHANEYQSFGFLPALDYLQVTADLIKHKRVNTRRLFVLGTSYGGYIALLMAKFAPLSFRMVIDNCGFSEANQDIYGNSLFQTTVSGVNVLSHEPQVWSNDPNTPVFFNEAHRRIRCMTEPGHLKTNTAFYYIYHYVHDTVAPVELKRQFVELMRPYATMSLTLIDNPDLDGVVFKTPSHGMTASLRGLFDRSYAAYLAAGGGERCEARTDFDLHSVYTFACGHLSYRFRYSLSRGVEVDMV